MKINVCIPTYNRFEMAAKAVVSILSQKHDDLSIFIYANGSRVAYENLAEMILRTDPRIKYLFSPERIGWVRAQNEVASITEDGFFYGADDIVLEAGCLKVAVREMEGHFPDGDGLVGVNQINFERTGLPLWPGAFGLVGQKFLLRFPDRKLFCEDYLDHYSDVELVQYAESIGKFHFAKDAWVTHYHPMVTKEMDETATLVSKTHNAMRSRHVMRKAYGYLWGKNFGRVFKAPDEIIAERTK